MKPPSSTVGRCSERGRGPIAAGILTLLLAVLSSGCGGDEAAKQCARAGSGVVCAWRDGGVHLSTNGLLPGSSFRFAVRGAEPGSLASSPALAVGADGKVDGAIGSISSARGRSVVQVSATSADGSTLDASLTVD